MFFLRRAKFSCGNGYHGKGTLERWPDDDSEQGIMNSVFDKSDPPVAYLEVKLSRDDAMAISAKYRARHTVEANPENTKRAAAVLKRPHWPLDVALAAVMSPDRDFVTAIANREDPGHLCIFHLSSTLGRFKALRHREVEIRSESPIEAWYTLRKSIFDGEITASGNEVDGPRAGGAQIPAVEAGTLELEMDGHPTFATFLRGGSGKMWRNIMIGREGLLRRFPLADPNEVLPSHDHKDDQAAKLETTIPGQRNRGGRKPGSGSFKHADEPLFQEMLKLIKSDAAASPEAAAKLVASRAKGSGTLESKVDRLAKAFRAKYGSDIARIKAL